MNLVQKYQHQNTGITTQINRLIINTAKIFFQKVFQTVKDLRILHM